MNYTEMLIPFELPCFDKMNKKQVEQYFNWFIETKEKRISKLQTYILRDEKNAVLDKTPESLIDLWKWFEAKIKWEEKSEEELRKEVEALPAWMEKNVMEHTKKVTEQTQNLMKDISVYFGDVLVSNNESIYWGYKMKPKKLYGVNRPLLLGFVGDQSLFPYGIISVCVEKSSEKSDIYQLHKLYKIWSEMAL